MSIKRLILASETNEAQNYPVMQHFILSASWGYSQVYLQVKIFKFII